jgi:hypothetical protein
MSLFQVAVAFICYEKKLREISDLIQQIRLLVPELPPSLEQVSEGKKILFWNIQITCIFSESFFMLLIASLKLEHNITIPGY